MRTAWLFVALPLVACAGEDSAWDPDKGDAQFDLYEAGPAPLDGSIAITIDRRVPAFRVASFGGTELAIELAGGHLVVEGPLAEDGDGVRIGHGTVIADEDGSVDVTLDAPGVYRILALGKGSRELAVRCTAGCTRPGIDQKAFVQLLAQQGGAAFRDVAKSELAKLVPDATLAQQLGAQLDAILADPALAGLERFPTIPLDQVAAVRPLLGGLPADQPQADAVVSGELGELLGDCTADRSLPEEIDARLPGVRYGQFPSTVLAPCQFAHASKLAQVLTSLAAQNGSSVTYGGRTLYTPGELAAALVATGHTIEVRNERMYANFLSMIVGDRDLIWPVWLDTGIALSSGGSFTIPVGHSHHAWRISGPDVNTRVMFYLGVSGTAFFGQTDARPAWSGTIAATDVTIASADSPDYAYLLATFDAAASYLRRNRVERATVAAGLPADGYGFLGVCNDSNATVEYATRGTVSAFPLLRAAELDAAAPLDDGLDDAVRALPKDGDGLADPGDALRRAVEMQPFPDGSPLMWDAVLGAQIATARRDAAH